MAEWSKAVDLRPTIERCVSSNLTSCNKRSENKCNGNKCITNKLNKGFSKPGARTQFYPHNESLQQQKK